ncbi:D-alanine--D-alanine ligase family protein [Candidatus Symbiothrix dinenymphae]|uniref:D-alanine--D-alanine ligase family protein n=1 Tax=Candidatus Symbiothrix dinenymphae TaxID=467085 RepID=UPI000703C147|nr:D-alanine--D-alanine ligase family protein [Candidatus Symbiothrix dinenymphae]
MTNNHKNIAIVAGGYSSESVVSLKSAQGIYSFIDKEKYNLFIVLITKDTWEVMLSEEGVAGQARNDGAPSVIAGLTRNPIIDKNDFSFTHNGEKIKFDFAYITIHGTPGENGLLQGYLDMLGIPYSCCGVGAAALTFNKFYCVNYLRNFGVKTAQSVLVRKNAPLAPSAIIEELGLPVFVKPNDGGSSFGTTKVHTAEELQPAIDEAFKEGQEVMIERFMPGTEVTCGCYKVETWRATSVQGQSTQGSDKVETWRATSVQGQSTPQRKTVVFPITEVVPKNEFFDYNAKYNLESEEITPARISQALTDEIQTLTSQIYDWVGAQGIIRVDYIISEAGNVRMLEVNTTPGMTSTSFIPQQVRAAGLDIKDVMTEIIENNGNNRRI